jgi:hypothetical protein
MKYCLFTLAGWSQPRRDKKNLTRGSHSGTRWTENGTSRCVRFDRLDCLEERDRIARKKSKLLTDGTADSLTTSRRSGVGQQGGSLPEVILDIRHVCNVRWSLLAVKSFCVRTASDQKMTGNKHGNIRGIKWQ